MSIENLSEAVATAGDGTVASTIDETKGVENSVTPTSWLDDFDEDLRNNKSLSKFSDAQSLAKSYIELERNFDKRVPLPSLDADDEAWGKFFKSAGCPEDGKYLTPQDREAWIKEGAEDSVLSEYEGLFAKTGLNSRQGMKLLEGLRDSGKNAAKTQEEHLAKEKEQNFKTLAEKYGESMDEKIKIVQASMQKYGTPQLAEIVEMSSYNPALVDLLIKIGEPLKSDSLIAGDSKPAANSKDAALLEIKRLESDDKFMLKYNDKNHAGNGEAVKRMKELYELAYN